MGKLCLLLYSPGWPWTSSNPPASGSQVLGSQVCPPHAQPALATLHIPSKWVNTGSEAVLRGALHVECPGTFQMPHNSASEDGANHMFTAHVCSRGNRTSAVSCPLIVIQTSRSLCLNPNPFLEEPNKLNLVPVRDRWQVITYYLSTFNCCFNESKIPIANYPIS